MARSFWGNTYENPLKSDKLRDSKVLVCSIDNFVYYSEGNSSILCGCWLIHRHEIYQLSPKVRRHYLMEMWCFSGSLNKLTNFQKSHLDRNVFLTFTEKSD